MNYSRMLTLVAVVATLALAFPAHASFHFMQIEQVIGGVAGDTGAQAIQLRMRGPGQNQVQFSRIRAHDAAGLNPVLIVDMAASVPSGVAGSRVLIATAGFSANTSPPAVPDFVMTNPIPAPYLAAGSLTFESDGGTIYWRLSWGGAGYTGSGTGLTTNDPDGNFNPPFAGPCPSAGVDALLFQGAAGDLSTTNAADYALTPSAAEFQNNAGQLFVVQAPPPPVLFDGLLNTALGQAQLQTVGGTLTVSNIGSSGCDGVSVDLSEVDGGKMTWQPLPAPPSLADGTALELSAEGMMAVGGSTNLGSLSATDVGSTVEIDADFSPLGSPSLRVEIYNGGAHVLTVEGHAGPVTADLMPSGWDHDIIRVPFPLPPFPPGSPGPFAPLPGYACTWDTPVIVTIPGSPPVQGTEMRMLPENPTVDIASVTSMDLLVTDPTGIEEITIVHEWIVRYSHAARGLGQVQLGTSSAGCLDCLIISNIGSSGCDGVSVDVEDSEIGIGGEWEPIDPVVPPGFFLVLSADGTVVGTPNTPLGSITVAPGGVGYQVTPDYSPIGSPTHLLELVLDGQVVFSQPGHTGHVEVPVIPTGCGKLGIPNPPVLCFFWGFDGPTNVTIPGGPTISADEIRMLAENPGFAYDTLDRLQLLANDVPGGELAIHTLRNGVSGDPPAQWERAFSIGSAQVHTTADHGHLTISNIGSSGCDGVSIDISPNVDQFRTDLAPLGDASSYADGTYLEIGASGKLDTQPSAGFLGSVRIEDVGSVLQVSTDYSPIGATMVLVRLWDDGLIVMEQLVADGPVVQLPHWIRGCGKVRTDDTGGGPGSGTLCIWIDPDDDTIVTVGGGSQANGSSGTLMKSDLVELLAANASGKLEHLTKFDLGAGHTGPPTAAHASRTPAATVPSGIPFILVTNLGAEGPSGADDVLAPHRQVLHPGYPNPFTSRATVDFDLARSGRVKLQVYSVTGALVRTIFAGEMAAGPQQLTWDGRDARGRRVATGTYFVRLVNPDNTVEARKITFIK